MAAREWAATQRQRVQLAQKRSDAAAATRWARLAEAQQAGLSHGCGRTFDNCAAHISCACALENPSANAPV